MKNMIDPFTKGVNPFDELDDFYKQQGDAVRNKGIDWEASDAARLRSIERVLAWLQRNVMLTKYIEHVKGNQSLNTLPEHALGERLYAMMTLALAGRGDIPIVTTAFIRAAADYDRDLFFQRSATGMAIMMNKAQVYLWTDKMEKLADASPLPPHTVSRDVLPMPIMFWSRETRYNAKGPDGRVHSNNWLLIFHQVDHMVIAGDLSYHDDESVKIVMDSVNYGLVWPNDYNNDTEVARILKRCAFMASPFVVTDRKRMTHTARRQLERDHGITKEAANEPECNVIALRRLKFKTPPQGTGVKGVEWKHHWWVNAHYRAQWYPSLQAHRVKWIAPHIKGDLSKPLLEKVYAVVR